MLSAVQTMTYVGFRTEFLMMHAYALVTLTSDVTRMAVAVYNSASFTVAKAGVSSSAPI